MQPEIINCHAHGKVLGFWIDRHRTSICEKCIDKYHHWIQEEYLKSKGKEFNEKLANGEMALN